MSKSWQNPCFSYKSTMSSPQLFYIELKPNNQKGIAKGTSAEKIYNNTPTNKRNRNHFIDDHCYYPANTV